MKNKYTFIKYEPKSTPDKNKITLNGHNLNIGKQAMVSIGNPQRVSIFYDADKKAIKLETDSDGRKITENHGYYQITVTLGKVMPKGRYYFKDGVFVLK